MANDVISYARDVYLANFPETDYVLGDIRDIETFPDAELLVGCYPCQGYSQGGARDASRSINYLYREFARALDAIKPKAFIVENVSGLVRSDNESIFADQLRTFRKSGAGYRVSYKALNAQDFGVAQDRKRVIIVGLRCDIDETFEFPQPTHGPSGFEPLTTIRDAIGHLPEWPVGEFCEDPFHWYYLSRDRRRNWIDVSKTIVSHMRHMPLHPSSPTLMREGPDEWRFANAGRARRFSYREAALLQGFDSCYTNHGGELAFPESDHPVAAIKYNLLRQRYRVVGNAVPPPMFEAVVRAMPDIWTR